MMKAPVTIAKVLAAFLSRLASNETCFFFLFIFRWKVSIKSILMRHWSVKGELQQSMGTLEMCCEAQSAFTPNKQNVKLQIFFTEQKSSLQSTILSFPRFLNALISIWYLQILNTYRSLIRRGWGRVGTRGLLGSEGMEENEKIHWQWDEVSTNLLNCSCCWPSLEVSSVGTTISPFLWSHFFFLNFILVEKEVVSVLPSPVQMMT